MAKHDQPVNEPPGGQAMTMPEGVSAYSAPSFHPLASTKTQKIFDVVDLTAPG